MSALSTRAPAPIIERIVSPALSRRPAPTTSLSVCCLTAGPIDRVATMLLTVREFADEIVVAVDDRVKNGDLDPLRGVADVIRFVPVGNAGAERVMNWLLRQCSCDWVLRLDGDEVPSMALLSALPHLVAESDVVQYVFARRWCYPDPYHWIDERPWTPDWQARLARNVPALRLEPARLHAGLARMDPHRFLQIPIYHLDCATSSLAQREQKADQYEHLRPEHRTEDGFNVNWYYLPEHHARRPPARVPAEDAALIAPILATSASRHRDGANPDVRHADPADIEQLWGYRDVSDDAYRASLTVLEELPRLRAGATTSVTVLASNDGTETWPWGDSRPAFRLGYRWTSASEPSVVHREGRTFFSADVAPGRQVVQPMSIHMPDAPGSYVLQLDVVHEWERWFNCGPRLAVTVTD
jgi:hypothetical protein